MRIFYKRRLENVGSSSSPSNDRNCSFNIVSSLEMSKISKYVVEEMYLESQIFRNLRTDEFSELYRLSNEGESS